MKRNYLNLENNQINEIERGNKLGVSLEKGDIINVMSLDYSVSSGYCTNNNATINQHFATTNSVAIGHKNGPKRYKT